MPRGVVRSPPCTRRSMIATVGAPPPVDTRAAARLLRDWGFLAVPDLPDRPGPAYLLVAIRAAPTLRHFDPELIRFWATEGQKGVQRFLSRGSPLPVDREFSWGLVQIEDRLKVTNEYLAFGGHLSAEMIDDELIAVFSSPAPLLRRGGHSQPWDRGADSIGAYFGRFLADVACSPAFEAEAADADPVARYAAFLADAVERYRESRVLRVVDPDLWALLRAEEHRLQAQHPSEWAQGQHLRLSRARTSAGARAVDVGSSPRTGRSSAAGEPTARWRTGTEVGAHDHH